MQNNSFELKKKFHNLVDRYDKKGHDKKIDNFFEIIRDLKIKKNSKTLEVGAGNGLFSHFLSVYFNSKVVSSDQYEGFGASVGTYETNVSVAKELGYDNVQVVKKDFWDFQSAEKFDYIFAINVVHHIIETENHLSQDPENYQKCITVFKKIHDLLSDGGIFLMRDVEKRIIKNI